MAVAIKDLKRNVLKEARQLMKTPLLKRGETRWEEYRFPYADLELLYNYIKNEEIRN